MKRRSLLKLIGTGIATAILPKVLIANESKGNSSGEKFFSTKGYHVYSAELPGELTLKEEIERRWIEDFNHYHGKRSY